MANGEKVTPIHVRINKKLSDDFDWAIKLDGRDKSEIVRSLMREFVVKTIELENRKEAKTEQ